MGGAQQCLLCLHNLASLGAVTTRRTRITGKTKQQDAARQDKIRHKVEATIEQVAAAFVGSLGHRIWKCPVEWMSKFREKWVPPQDLATTQQCSIEGHPIWERALQPRPTKPKKSIAKQVSFRWVIEPEGGMFEGIA